MLMSHVIHQHDPQSLLINLITMSRDSHMTDIVTRFLELVRHRISTRERVNV